MSDKILRKSEILNKIEAGYTREKLAEYYGISKIEMARYLKEFGIRSRAKKKPTYQLIDDTGINTNLVNISGPESINA